MGALVLGDVITPGTDLLAVEITICDEGTRASYRDMMFTGIQFFSVDDYNTTAADRDDAGSAVNQYVDQPRSNVGSRRRRHR